MSLTNKQRMVFSEYAEYLRRVRDVGKRRLDDVELATIAADEHIRALEGLLGEIGDGGWGFPPELDERIAALLAVGG